MHVHDYPSAIAFLMGRINYEQAARIPYSSREFKLRRMEQLLAALGDPHHRLPAVHIAGTKGKGSTAVMVESILRAAGYRTGLYTSPHLERVEERFALNGLPCSEEQFVRATQEVQVAVEALDTKATASGKTGPTYFEVTTAIAMSIFAAANVDIAVLEVGLGGRLDSTNVCRPLVSVITSISYDHTKQLGNTLTSIAGEKAGIIKPGVPVISGVVGEEAASVIRAVAAKQGCVLRELDTDFPHCDDTIKLAMIGAHQSANAALAIASVRELAAHDFDIPEAAIRSGLFTAVCPARIELVREHPPIILDAAHNVASCEALVAALAGRYAEIVDRTLILATSNDKDASGMLSALLPFFSRVIFTKYQHNPRAADPHELHVLASALLEATVAKRQAGDAIELLIAKTPESALTQFQRVAMNNSLLCIAGSFFLAGEIRPLLNALPATLRSVPR